MFILKEATLLGADPFIYPGSEHKKGDNGDYYGYCSVYPSFKDYEFNPRQAKDLDYYFSFNTKTGEIDFTGYPWDFIKEEIAKKPYPPEIIAFMKKENPNFKRILKLGRSIIYYVDGKWTTKEPKI